MKLEQALIEYSAAVRQRHGFVIIIRRTSDGYHVSFAEQGCEPHLEQTYATLGVVSSLFAETCSWHPLENFVDAATPGAPGARGVLSFPAVEPEQVVPYTRAQVERFWAKVDSSDPTGCWPWTGNRNTSSGFGIARTEKGRMLAHRVAWELTHGVQLSSDEYILHLRLEEGCGNILCVRPEHLYLTRERRVTRPGGSDDVQRSA